MTTDVRTEPLAEQPTSQAQCPINHVVISQQKTARAVEPPTQPVERTHDGVWHIRGYAEAHAILRAAGTKQAGFNAELIDRIPSRMNMPVLYQEGQDHHQQRKQTARYFTPKAVDENYRQLMEGLSDRIIAHLKKRGQADLSNLSMRLAVQVAGKVVGLTNSLLPGMDRRLDAFFGHDPTAFGWSPWALLAFVRTQARLLLFFGLDVKPAIRARRRRAQDDVISHLLAQSYRDAEIFTECITYAAAGMATTREFISVATWHFLEQPALRARFLIAPEAERHAMLEEILRLEPVVAHLYRRATTDIEFESAGTSLTIPAGALIDIHIHAANTDPAVVGDDALQLCPGRTINADRATAPVMSFGDGHHRCPGAFIALQETDIFLQRLLALPSLRIERKPTVTWNDAVSTYELRKFILAV